MYTTDESKKRTDNTGAITRIVIWSLVLCILAGVFAYLMISEGVNGKGLGLGVLSTGGYSYSDPDSYTVGGGTYGGAVNEIDVSWINGSVTVVPTDENEVRIEETYSGEDESLRLRWKVEGGELTVKYRKADRLFGTGKSSPAKALTIRIPRAMLDDLNEVDLDVVDADMAFTGRTRQLDVDGVRGALTVNGHVGELNMDLVDGSLDYTGTLGNGDLDGVNIKATLRLETAESLDVDGVDHEVTVLLAESVTGFRLRRSAVGGDTAVEGFDHVDTLGKDGRRWGDGSFNIDVGGVDVKVTVKKSTND